MKKIILVILLVVVLPFHIHAAPITIEGAGLGQTIEWSFLQQGDSGFAGQILTSLGTAYCAQINEFISSGQTYEYTPYAVFGANYILAAVLIDQFGGYLGSNEMAAGLQAAIWEAIYGENFELNTTGAVAQYQQTYLRFVDIAGNPTAAGFAYLDLGTNQDLLARVESVPEPGTMLLLGLGLLGLGITTRGKL